jgi:hypothetical protein
MNTQHGADMNVTIRSSDLTELADRPELIQQAGTATVVSGTGAFVAPISMLREIAGSPDAIQQLEEMAEALAEQEQLYAMAILGSAVTGIANTLWYIPVPEGRHGPRIKVAIDPPHAKRPGGTEATVPFDESKPASGPIPPALERQVRAFIALNTAALLDYWNLKTTTDEFVARLRPIAPHV